VGNLHLDDARLTVAFNGQGDILADARLPRRRSQFRRFSREPVAVPGTARLI